MDLPTSKIIEKLVMCGIPFTQEAFLIDVHNHYGSGDIYMEWERRYTITAKGFDEDFPWMAAEVLWRRLVPDKISTMQLDDWVQDGYELTEQNTSVSGCDLWLKVWENLKPRITMNMRKVEDADGVSFQSQYLLNWFQDVEIELLNAAVEEPDYHDRRIHFCWEVIECFPESPEILPVMKRGIAESLCMSGKWVEGEAMFQEIFREYPSDPWAYITLGDIYRGLWEDPEATDGFKRDEKKAEELYRMALGKDPKSDEMIKERLRDLKVGYHRACESSG